MRRPTLYWPRYHQHRARAAAYPRVGHFSRLGSGEVPELGVATRARRRCLPCRYEWPSPSPEVWQAAPVVANPSRCDRLLGLPPNPESDSEICCGARKESAVARRIAAEQVAG
jgi:hypothetical protein